MIHLFTGAIFIFLYFRFVRPLPLKRGKKLAISAALLLLSQQHLFIRFFATSLASPEIPPFLLMLVGWSVAALLFLTFLVLLRDIVFFIGQRVARGLNPPFSPARRGALLAGLALAGAAYSVRQALAVPEARALQVYLPRLPRDLDGLRLVQVSDTHISQLFQKSWLEAVVDKVNHLKPDIVALTGDIVDGLPWRRAASLAPLRELKAGYGVFACPGNHEYYGDYRAWTPVWPTLGIDMLANRHQIISIKNQEIVMAGITDLAAAAYNLPQPDLGAALAGAPAGGLRIMLSHRPASAAASARAEIDLQLSGHTHGGQIIGINQLVAQFNQGYLHGWYQVGQMMLYVNCGAGLWNGFPVRLGVPSEIVCITLVCSQKI
jgi:predicted MPP superfamily phosphohydrolase